MSEDTTRSPAVGHDDGVSAIPAGPVRDLGARLASMLDEDRWASIEPYLLACLSQGIVRPAFIEELREHLMQFIENLSDEYKDSPNALGALGRTMKYIRTLEINPVPAQVRVEEPKA